jgi:DNA-binding MarR family transcriptional regulator
VREDQTFVTLGHLIRRVAQLHDRYFEQIAGDEVTPRQFALLIALSREPDIGQIQLANRIAIDRTTTGQMAHRLELAGYLKREPHPLDGRRKVLRVSVKGMRLIEKLAERVDAINDAILEPLNAEERATLLPLLAKLALVDDPTFPGYKEGALMALGRMG